MERYTHERLNGIQNGYWSPNKKQELVDRLAAYENTELDPEQIQKLKERDTAKAPVDIDDEFDMYTCPSCNMAIGAMGDREEHHFCLNCGQRLKWG